MDSCELVRKGLFSLSGVSVGAAGHVVQGLQHQHQLLKGFMFTFLFTPVLIPSTTVHLFIHSAILVYVVQLEDPFQLLFHPPPGQTGQRRQKLLQHIHTYTLSIHSSTETKSAHLEDDFAIVVVVERGEHQLRKLARICNHKSLSD